MGLGVSYILQGESPGELSNPTPQVSATSHDMTFSAAGFLVVTTVGRYPVAGASRFVRSLATLVTAGTTATILTLRKNTTTMGTITIPAGQTGPVVTVWDFLAADLDTIQANITTAGNNAANLVVVLTRMSG